MTTTGEAASGHGLLLEMLDPAQRPDPYPLYARLRDGGPMHLPEMNLAVFSGYDDCDRVLRHPDSSSDRSTSTPALRAAAAGEVMRPLGQPGFLFLDPPDHTRLRRLVSTAFTPKVVAALTPEIERLVGTLLDESAAAGTLDVIDGLSYPLPVAVICRLLGVPLADEPQFSEASAAMAASLDPFITITGGLPENYDERVRLALWLRDYLRELIDRRRREPGDDLMSGLVAAEEAGDALTEEEIVATCNLLLVAGHETTVNLIANAVLALLRTPGQWAATVADPDRIPRVLEETLRWDPPVQLVARNAAADMTIGGLDVPRGDIMMLLIAAAHRDESAHERADVFDPDRPQIRHLGFGRGPHFCLGAPLARLESTIALRELTSRFPGAHLDGDPQWKPNLTLRGMSSLPVALGT